MYHKCTESQPEFADFYLPFNGRLDSSNRWVRFAEMIPWDELEKKYSDNFSFDQGRPSLPVRVAFGALVIKAYLNVSDRETVESIRENVYLQYFLGYREFVNESPFDSSMMVHFRKRFDLSVITEIQDQLEKSESNDDNQDEDEDQSPTPPSSQKPDSSASKNQGKLVLDATVSPADIRYPRDVDLLNETREKSEAIIDELHEELKGKQKKVRTYRKKARKKYLSIAKKKRPSPSTIRKAVRSQLGFLNRNLGHINGLLDKVGMNKLSPKRYREYLVIQEVYRQQQQMWTRRENRIEDRIVSFSQPHVRPIVRGKTSASTEFGAKFSVSLVNGIARVDHLSWDNFNESTDLQTQVETYRKRFGYYPESVHADKIYRTRENRKFLKDRKIRMSGPALGRPRVITDLNERRLVQNQCRQDELDRIPIEGKFGQGKRRFSLNRILARLTETSASWIGMTFFVMNLIKLAERLFFALAFWLLNIENLRFIRMSPNLHDFKCFNRPETLAA